MIKNVQRYDNYMKSTCNFEQSSYMCMAPAYFCHVSFMKMPKYFTYTPVQKNKNIRKEEQ